MKPTIKHLTLIIAVCGLFFVSCCKKTEQAMDQKIDNAITKIKNQQHDIDLLEKKIDDLLWYEKVGDIAYIDKVRLAGPARWKPKNKDDKFAANPLQFYSYVFIPKNIKNNQKYPLIVFPHSGIHANFSTYYAHIVREFIAQGYIIIASEYRGSTGYGQATYENIDYGGLENDDVRCGRNYMIQNYSMVDSTRIGIVGWSHGGMISLMEILRHPDLYNCAFAGVPVSDLHNRLTSHGKEYEAYFTPQYHIGATLKELPEEYKRRSPSSYARKLQKPLLIHTNTNDNDVYVEEVLLMIDSLKKYDKEFKYKVFENEPGGHGFDRIDSKEATDIRFTIHQFINSYLMPPQPFKDEESMRKAAYRFN